MVKNFEQIPIHSDDGPENPERRKFIKKALKTGVQAGIGAGISAKVVSLLEEEKKGTKDEVNEIRKQLHEEEFSASPEEQKERVPVVLSPLHQLEAWGEIRDMQAGVEAIKIDHYQKLVATDKGKGDLRAMVENISQLDLREIARPYRELGLPEELAYMVAIQETRARNLTSHAGAKGMTGLMPETIKSMGFEEKDAFNPYKANVMTARYFATERDDRFGNDIDLLLHAYNAGGGMLGYTATRRSKKERNIEDFYAYMQDLFNEQYKAIEKEITEKGHFTYTLTGDDKTLTHVSRKFDVALKDLLEVNGFTQETIIHQGDNIHIPCSDPIKAAKTLLRKPFEAIRYTPEVKAKYQALKEKGYIHQIELAMNEE